MVENVIDATARFILKPGPTEGALARREVVRRARQLARPKAGCNDNDPPQI